MATISYTVRSGEWLWIGFGHKETHVFKTEHKTIEIKTAREFWRAIDEIEDLEWEDPEWYTEWLPTLDGDCIDYSTKQWTTVKNLSAEGLLDDGTKVEDLLAWLYVEA